MRKTVLDLGSTSPQSGIHTTFMKVNYKEMRTFVIIGVILFLMFMFSNFQDFLILIG